MGGARSEELIHTHTHTHTHTQSKTVRQQLGDGEDGEGGEGGEEWWEKVGVWNQVFRVRSGGRAADTHKESQQSETLD